MKPFSIALAGKGGTGKTTMAGLLVKYLMNANKTPVLAVDADANGQIDGILITAAEALNGYADVLCAGQMLHDGIG